MTRCALPGLVTVDHRVQVPLDHADPGAGSTTVFAREVVAPRREHDDLPWLLFLQGGPGMASPRPVDTTGWIGRLLQDFRVLLMDQRGTGLSTPLSRQTLAGLTPAEQARRLALHRADSIVRDAELLRRELAGDRPWTILGQSFGGFCALTYLSSAPHGLAGAMVTGGLAPLTGGPDPVYRATYRRALAKGRAHFARFPADRVAFTAVADRLRERDVRLPGGDRLTVERLQTLGVRLGMRSGSAELHHLLEGAFVDGPAGPELSDVFLAEVERRTSFLAHPLYALLHEPIYCQGEASRWSAERVRAEFPELDDPRAPMPTGETVHPWMFEEMSALAPLREAAGLLAAKDDWPALYDLDRLADNEVPVVATVYDEDLYVDSGLARATADRVRGLRAWTTNQFEHDGLSESVDVVDRLLAMLRGEV